MSTGPSRRPENSWKKITSLAVLAAFFLETTSFAQIRGLTPRSRVIPSAAVLSRRVPEQPSLAPSKPVVDPRPASGMILPKPIGPTPTPPATSADCSSCDGGTIVVDEDVVLDFNPPVPTCSDGSTDDLCEHFQFDTSGQDIKDWKAIFDLGPKALRLASGATIRFITVGNQGPGSGSNQKVPGLVMTSTCTLEVEEGAAIVVHSQNEPAGDVFIKVDGGITVNGRIENSVGGTLGRPGKITLASCCGNVVTGDASRIETLGVDQGGSDINILNACPAAAGDIEIHGLVQARHKFGPTPAINVVSFGGTVLIDGTSDRFGVETVGGTAIQRTSGLLVHTLNATAAGDIRIQAKGDVTVVGKPVVDMSIAQFGAVAVKPHSTNGQGGDGDILVVSLEGRIVSIDRAFDFENRFNALNAITLLAKGDVELGVSELPNSTPNDGTDVVTTRAGKGGTGGTNTIRSFSGAIFVAARARVRADFTTGGSNGVDVLTACSGVVNDGLVIPPDSDAGDDSGVCSPDAPDPLFVDGEDPALGVDVSCDCAPPPPPNQPPTVNAGPDQALTLPNTLTLSGSVTDDGLPEGGALSILWSQVSGPPTVSFSNRNSAITEATFPEAGTYVLRLTANDSELSASDEVTVVVEPEPPSIPGLSIGDAALVEQNDGTSEVELTVALSFPSAEPVSVDFVTTDGTASSGSDYLTRFGTVSFPAGDVAETIKVPVVGDIAQEPEETFAVLLGNPVAATLDDDRGVVTIQDDDTANDPPSLGDFSPPDASKGLDAHPTLSWTALDPDGDPLAFDVYFGTAFGTTGQRWTRLAPATEGPGPRAGAASAYDEANDRLIVFGGEASGAPAEPPDAWVLTHASGAGRTPAWTLLSAGGGPLGRRQSTGAYDAATNRFILNGGCTGTCDAALADTWVLTQANGEGGPPVWISLPDAPSGRAGHVAAYDRGSNRLIVFGGAQGNTLLNDLWTLRDANGIGNPAWEQLDPLGSPPEARSAMVGAFDAASNRFIVFGGRLAGDVVSNEAFILSNANGLGGRPEWTRLTPAGTPPAPRWGSSAVYDLVSHRLTVFGGTGPGFDANENVPAADAWMLKDADGIGSPEWIRLAPEDGPPPGRLLSLASYSGRQNRMVLYGGKNNRAEPALLDDLWVLRGAAGSLPLASAGQSETSFPSTTPSSTPTYYWRIEARDDKGAAAGSPVFGFRINAAPSVDAGPDRAVPLPPGTLALSATATDDGEPQPLSFAWSQVSGPANVTFADPNSAATLATFPLAGSYVLRIRASDSRLSAEDELNVMVERVNQAPLVDAGADQALTLPSTASLNGAVTDDGLPGPFVVTWSVASGPGSVSFADPASPVTTASFGVAGLYVLRLTASDGELQASDDIRVFVASADLPLDLVVRQVDASALVVDPRTLEVTGTVAAEIENKGSGPAAGPFTVTFFEDRKVNGVFDPAEDNFLGAESLIGLEAGAPVTVPSTVAGAVQFRGNLIYAFVDSGLAVAESNEANNYGSSAAACRFEPPRQPSSLALEWAWTNSSVLPDATHVLMAPAVMDLNGDGVPEVIFSAVDQFNKFGDAHLRAVRGDNGAEVFTVTDSRYELFTYSPLAVGDIDGNGVPEIIAVHEDDDRLVCFNADGTVRWETPVTERLEVIHWGGPAIAHLDDDGVADIVVGREAVSGANGRRLWRGTGGRGSEAPGRLSIVANLDRVGKPEVLAGNTAYRADGSIYWQNNGVPDGLDGIGNFDDDAFPEIVVVARGQFWVLEHTGEIKAGPFQFNAQFLSSPPVIADFNADGKQEIGIHDRDRFYIYETDGQKKWEAPIEENSAGNSASAFDFDGDGAAELVYSDTQKLKVFDGRSGSILFETQLGHLTAFEYPIVADVDADGNVEIVAPVSRGTVQDNSPGVHVFGDSADNWTLARKVWNQHTYHVTNVNDDGTIPAVEVEDWGRFGLRQNVAATVGDGGTEPECAFAKPDLTASFLRLGLDGVERTLTVRIGNGGAALAGPDVPVSFYDGDPALGGLRLGTVHTTRLLSPGEFQDVALALPQDRTTAHSVWIVADDFGDLKGAVTESDEDNNVHDSGQALLGAAVGQPDLAVKRVNTASVTGNWQTLVVSGSVSAEIRNQGEAPAVGLFTVAFFEDLNANGQFDGADNSLGSAEASTLAGGDTAVATAAVSGSLLFRNNPIYAFVDSGGVVPEANEANNVARSGDACAFRPPGSFSPQIEWSWTHPLVQPTSTNVAVSPAVGDLNGDGAADVVFVSFSGVNFSVGHLRALSGRDGRELFANPPAVAGRVNPAIGDLDADGVPEIVVGHTTANRLMAYRNDGSPKWASPSDTVDSLGWGAPSIANLDGAGDAEIVFGRYALRSNGRAYWSQLTITSKGESGGTGPFPIVADLDLDGRPEVILGNTALEGTTGAVRWQAPVPDGLTAVGNFDSDPYPEIVLAAENDVWLLEHTGTVRWGPLSLPGGGTVGVPVVADVDGDGRVEIAIGTFRSYNLVETSGFVRWSQPAEPGPTQFSAGTSGSAFDFDGDGAFELVYADKLSLRIFSGRDGAVLAQQALTSCSNVGRSYPVVADLDGDGRAEIVSGFATGVNAVCTGANTGVFALGDSKDNWVAARPLWNQHGYHVTNVNDNLEVPLAEAPSWLLNNSYRANRATTGFALASPDLTASFVRRSENGPNLRFTARIGNLGASAAPAGVPVAFYNGHPFQGFPFLDQVSTTRVLKPGEFEDVTVSFPSSLPAEGSLFVVADDDGTRMGIARECNDEGSGVNNNLHDSGLYLNRAPVVEAGADRVTTLPEGALLVGSASDDGLPLGAPLVLTWESVSRPVDEARPTFSNPHDPVTHVSFPIVGEYVIRLRASDTALETGDTLRVMVLPGNFAPQVDAGPDQVIALPTDTVTLAGTATDDGRPEGSALAFSWTMLRGPGRVNFANPNALTTTASFEAAGFYLLRLTVSDGDLSATDDVRVEFQAETPVGPPPVVAITSPAERAGITEPVEVVGSVSSDTLFSWRLEYRQVGEPSFIRLASGNTPVANEALGIFDPTLLLNDLYEIRLTAMDRGARTTSTSVQVVVKENQKIGHFTVSFVDLEVPVSGLPIRVTRTYDSRDKRLGDFGFGWRLDLSSIKVSENGIAGLSWAGTSPLGPFPVYCLQPRKPLVVSVTMPDGKVYEFEPFVSLHLNSPCQPGAPPTATVLRFRPLPGTVASLEPADGGDVIIVSNWRGDAHLFDPANFNLYDPDRYKLTLPDGREFLVDQKKGVLSLKDLNGNTLTVGPGGVTHSSGQGVVFQRDNLGRITSITDPAGNSMSYGYDAAGDLKEFTDRENNTTTFTYLADIPHHLDAIKDPRGIQPIRNDYDPVTGRLLRHTDAFNKTIEYTHQLGTRQEIVQDRNGKQRVLEYDPRGNVVRETDPEGKVILRSFDAHSNRTCEIDPHDPGALGPTCEETSRRTLYTYDLRDNLTSVTDPQNNRTEYTYNTRRQVLTTKDPLGKVTENRYDAKGNLELTIDSLANETRYTYDGQGNVKTQAVTLEGQTCTTGYDYDRDGNLTRETDPLGHATDYTYDPNGNRKTQTTTRTLPTGATETLVTTFTYDKLGRLVETKDPDDSISVTEYDELGKQKATVDKLGRRTTFLYDPMGRLIKTTYPDTTTEESTYDNEGRRQSFKDRDGRTTLYDYDGSGRLIKTTYPDLNFTTNSYDDAGRLKATTDARGKTTSYEYDAAGRRTAVTDPLTNRTEFGYDANGNQTSVKDPKGEVTQFDYDALNRRTKTTFPNGTFTETTYDSLGRRTSEADQTGKKTRFEYDCLGRLTKVVDALSQPTSYQYDSLGSRTLQQDSNGHETKFEYDKLGRETKRTLPDGKFEEKTYDAAGNLKRRFDFNNRTTTYDYDVNNRLITRSYPDTSTVEFTYTGTGRRFTAKDARGRTDYSYDSRDRLQSLTYPDLRKLEYGYDPNGNRTSLKATIGAQVLTTAYSYDDASRLDIVTDPQGRPYDFNWDKNGNRESLIYPNTTKTDYTYDRLNRLTDLFTTRGPATVQRYTFTLGPAGNRTNIAEHDGTVRDYTYDDLYRLTSETVSGSFNYAKAFSYDPVGNRQRQVTTGFGAGDVSYTYDTRDRLLTEGAQPYTWDDNGNLISKDAEATYFWDFENRLIKVQKADGTVVEHLYDPDGNRLQTKTTPAGGATVATNYLVDTSGALSHVVAETDNANSLVAYYVRADDLLALMRPDGGGGFISRFYHSDGLGSIRRLTDEAGNITDGYSYSAFGELLAHTGSDPQPYSFAGEPYDPNSGFYYNRARWLDARVGRFASEDPFDGAIHSPSSLHKYLYADQDPPNRSDPTGLTSFATTGFTISVLGRISAISLPVFRTALQWVYVNYFTIHTFASRLATALEIATVGLAALETTSVVLDRMSRQLASFDEVYPEGNFPRGFEVGLRAGQNLADDFPKIDHYEHDIAVSIKSTTQVEDSGTFLKVVREGAEELRDARGPLSGRNAAGQRITIDMRQAKGRALLVAIPLEPLGWNPTSISRQLASLSARMRVLIRVVPVRGLRGR